jgi:hypothetical protein
MPHQTEVKWRFFRPFNNFAHFFIVCFLKLFNPLCTKETNIKRHMILLRTMWSCSWIAIFLMFYDTVNGNASSINLNKITKTMSFFFGVERNWFEEMIKMLILNTCTKYPSGAIHQNDIWSLDRSRLGFLLTTEQDLVTNLSINELTIAPSIRPVSDQE